MTINGAGNFGRFVPNMIAHKIGPITLIIPFVFAAGACLILWPFLKNSEALYVWAVIYGFAAGGVQSLFPPGLASVTDDPKPASGWEWYARQTVLLHFVDRQ